MATADADTARHLDAKLRSVFSLHGNTLYALGHTVNGLEQLWLSHLRSDDG
jgi:hypothetical protein